MKRVLKSSVLFFLFAPTLFAQNRPDEIYQRGWITPDSLYKAAPEFQPLPGAYQPQERALQLVRCYDEPVTVLIFFGSWCSDSKRELPHFFTTLALANNKNISTKLFGLDRTKKEAAGFAEAFKIEKVPTFIFLRGRRDFSANAHSAGEHAQDELGRIIETPAISLEQDCVNVLKRNNDWGRKVEFEQMLIQLGLLIAFKITL
jgi:thiol-disulfide isomerase/thioredoxin